MRGHRADKVIAVLTFLLMGLGLIVIYASVPMRANFMNQAYGENYATTYFFIHQLVSVVIATAAFFVAYKYPYAKLRQYAKILVIVALALCAVMAVLAFIGSSLVSCQLGACRWFNFRIVSLQPEELLKLSLVLYLAQLLASRKEAGKLNSWAEFWRPFTIVCVLSLLFVIVLQKDLGTGVAVVAIILAELFMSGIELKKFMMVLLAMLVMGVMALVVSPHRLERMMTFSGGEGADSYHIDNAMIAIGTGGFAGVGVGNSVQATGYLPESINDSVFAVMGETFGFVGLMTVLACFTVLLLRLLSVAERLADLEQGLVVTGVFAWMMAHVVVNIAAMTGLMPLTGITLPLLSYGGTSMLFVAAGLGLAVQLSRYTERRKV